MQCKTCEYRLWNLPSRICPECGTPFRPSDFDFVPNTVQFCCPHCRQQYYGTDERGHLTPVEFDCVSCGRHVHMDEMVLLPAEGVAEDQTRPGALPWLERGKHGLLRCWLRTVGLALIRPGALIEMAPPKSKTAAAWWFAIFSNFLFGLVFLLPVIFFVGGGVGRGVGLGAMTVFTLLLVTCLPLMLAIWGLLAHLLLRITGRVQNGIGRTYQCLCYSAGANVLMAVPCFGIWISWLWWLVSGVLMVRSGQRVHPVRATFSVLSPPLGLLLLLFLNWGWYGTSGFGSAAAIADVSQVSDAVFLYAETNGYQGPAHAVELIEHGHLEPIDFVAADSDTILGDISLGGPTLEDYDGMTQRQRSILAGQVVSAQPPNLIAHRMGDYVFTYHGITLNQCDPRLWVVMMSFDPDARLGSRRGESIYTVSADGSISVYQPPMFSVELGAQNNIRAKASLAPLPDPETVTHDKPAVGVYSGGG